MYIIETEKSTKILTLTLDCIRKYDKLYKVKTVRFIESPLDISFSEISSIQVSKHVLVDFFHKDKKHLVDYIFPLQLMQCYKIKGINVELLYQSSVIYYSGSKYIFLPICKEAAQEIEKINALNLDELV